MTIIDILKEMKTKGFTADTKIDLSFKNGDVARCRLSDFFPAVKEFSKLYANMNGKLTTYYSVKEMLDMNLIVIEEVE